MFNFLNLFKVNVLTFFSPNSFQGRLHLALLSGLLIGLSFIPFFPILLLVCYLPLWRALFHESSLKRIFLLSWLTQFALSLVGFYWIAYVSKEFGYLPWPVAILALLLFAALIHLYIPVAASLSFYLRNKFSLSLPTTLLILAGLLASGEKYWPVIFPWNLGYPLMLTPLPLIQWADTVGFAGISYGVYLTQALLGIALWSPIARRRLLIGGWLFLFTALNLTGWIKKSLFEPPNKSIKVLQVQANIGNLEKAYAERGAGYQEFIAKQYFDLTRKALSENQEVDLILWPESAFPAFLNPDYQNNRYSRMFYDFMREVQIPIITGAYSRDRHQPGESKDFNALFAFDAKGEMQSPPYHKTYLLIFGETIPFVDQFPWLAKYNPGGAGFGRGPGPSTLQIDQIRFGAQICYESLYPQFSAELARKGAQIIVNVTNDSWFGPTIESYQHLYMTLARALEVRLPLLRSTNTGITSAILADGQILNSGPRFEPWYGFYEIPYHSEPELSFYALYAEWVDLFPLLVSLILLLLNLKNLKKLRE